MTEADEEFAQLRQLIELRSVSPMKQDSVVAVSDFLSNYGFEKAPGVCWVRERSKNQTWIYAHVDTKPPLPQESWNVEPFELTKKGELLFGLGVSDAKFQLLNALDVFNEMDFNMLVDGGEESGSFDAVEELTRRGVRRLAIVDGAMPQMQIYGGLFGQVDGCIDFDSGRQPQHPSRGRRTEAATWLVGLLEEAKHSRLHLNVTGIMSEQTERSLTMERVRVRFDLRYQRTDADMVQRFMHEYRPTVRQHFKPLHGTNTDATLPQATFSSPLGELGDSLEAVWVLPGGLPENGNHRPNESIFIWQIAAHRNLLRRFASMIGGCCV